jgi:hypothetical protein
MSYKGLSEQLISRINPVAIRTYAIATGWKRVATVNGTAAVYTHSSGDLDQLIVPLEDNVSDYARRIAEVIANLAEKENRPAGQILNDLLVPPSDILRFRIDDSDSQSGLLPLEQGLGLLEGAKKALLAAACSVIQPRTFHPRLSRSEAELLIEECLLGQTERGSYTAVICCPLGAAESDPLVSTTMPLFEAEPDFHLESAQTAKTPFTRLTTTFLMRSVNKIAAALDADRSDILFKHNSDDLLISANLCDALVMMEPDGERSRLALTATWSRLLPPQSGHTPPSSVQLRKEYFPAIGALAESLRPVRKPEVSQFVGLVDSLNGDPDEQGQVRGEVQLLIFTQDESIRARVNLDADDYQTALKAHGTGGYVSFNGILVRGNRVHRITEFVNFKSLKS